VPISVEMLKLNNLVLSSEEAMRHLLKKPLSSAPSVSTWVTFSYGNWKVTALT